MTKLAPKETSQNELPQQVGGLYLVNNTIAAIDYEAEIEDGNLKVTIQGIYLGKTEETPFEATKKSGSSDKRKDLRVKS